MIITNKATNTKPLFAHAQGLVHDTTAWKEIVATKPKIDSKFDTDQITILTFVSGKDDFSLTKQLDASGIKYINAATEDIGYWSNKMKIKLIAESCKTITTPYILCLDALDILCVEDLSSLLDRFAKFDCDVLYNASKFNYPIIMNMEEDTLSKYKYLNAGAFIGKIEAIKNFYDFLVETELYRDYKGFDLSEQIRVRMGRKGYTNKKRIKVDCDCEIFQTLNKTQFSFNNNELTIDK